MTKASKALQKTSKYVYLFGNGKADGDGSMKALLGGKGANLAEMSRIGLPVPPGFTITTEVCTYYYANKRTYPKDLQAKIEAGIAQIEKIMGTKFGDKKKTPLLVSVRSGARDSMTTLSSYMSDAANRTLPQEAVEKTKHVIIDTLAAMISGSQLPPGKFALKFAGLYKGQSVATVAGSTILCGPIEAALVNGLLAHSDETDDSHAFSQSHPGASVVPSSLAVGEQFGIDGTRFLRAVALGYDIGPRVTMMLGRVPYMKPRPRLCPHSMPRTPV